jgi:histidine ammonia-lyase
MAGVTLTGESLTVDQLVEVARRGRKLSLGQPAAQRMAESRKVVDDLVEKEALVYGVTTGFGEFASIRVSAAKAEELQRNLMRSHAAGVGVPLPPDVVRGMMTMRANTLAKGYSGIRPDTVRLLMEMVNQDVLPVVPSRGSVGSSGDLAPLAHLGLAMMGEGECVLAGKTMDAKEALKKAGLRPVVFGAKEGLALVNGTCMMASFGALLVHDATRLLQDAQVAGAMSLEALRGTDQAFRPEIGLVRPHAGQILVAKNLWNLTRGSEIMQSHKDPVHKVQDAYTLRCMPQVFGATMDALGWIRGVVATELNSATDNPLIFTAKARRRLLGEDASQQAERAVGEGAHVLSDGNFHGQHLAIALDLLAIAVAELADISERRIARLVDPKLSGMEAFLTRSGGLNSGFMVAQYTAAALVSENKILCHPASVDNIPTSANQEDHNSMGSVAALKGWQVLDHARMVIAIEYLCAAQGLDFNKPLKPGAGAWAAYKAIRAKVPTLEQDRPLAPDFDKVVAMMRDGAVLGAVEKAGVRLA